MNLWEDNLLINGRFCQSENNRCYAVINPFSDAVIGHAADASKADILAAIHAAKRAYQQTDWSCNKDFRRRCLKQLAAVYEDARHELQQVINQEIGTPMGIVKDQKIALSAVDRAGVIKQGADALWAKAFRDKDAIPGQQSVAEKKKPCVVAVISNWSTPIETLLARVLQVLATGCTLIIKAAPETPLSTLLLGRLISKKTNIPEGVVNIITAKEKSDSINAIFTDDKSVDLHMLANRTPDNKTILEAEY